MMKRRNLILLAGVAAGCLFILFVVGLLARPSFTSELRTANSFAPIEQAAGYGGLVADGEFAAAATSSPMATQAAPQDVVQQQSGEQPAQPEAQTRLIIRNATLGLTVDDPAAKLDQISALAGEMGGWVVSSNISTNGTGENQRVSSANIVLRVDANRLDETLARIKDGVGTVNSENISGQDVTAQYIDMRSRVTNLEAAERQLQSILADARRTEDVLIVFNELTRTRGEIESIRGQMQFYEQAAAYSSVNVTLYPTPITPQVEVLGWRPQDTIVRAAQALVNVLQGAVDVLIFIAIFILPLLLIAGIPVFFILRRVRRQRRAAQA
jgi:Domain of unknown function (DUF4349)